MSSTRRASEPDDLAAVLARPQPVYETRCYVAIAVERLRATDPEGADALASAADNPLWPCTNLARLLRDRDIDLHARSLQRHRRRDCRCPT